MEATVHTKPEDMATSSNTDTASSEPDAVVQAKSPERPLDPHTNKSSLDETTITLRSGRIIQKWRTEQQARRRHFKNNIGHSVQFEFVNSPDARSQPMSDVFNTPELLEQILLKLETGFILLKAQSVCRGFQQSMDASPEFRKRRTFAIRVDSEIDENGVLRSPPTFHVNLGPKSMYPLRCGPGSCQANFLLGRGCPSFEELKAIEGLRRLLIFERGVLRIIIRWRSYGYAKRIVWEDTKQHGSGYTFGDVFDAVARRARGKVFELSIYWFRVSESEYERPYNRE
jgi:hypothetical protein